jgi:hypothetical protein
LHFLVRSRIVFVGGGTYLIFAVVMTLAEHLPEIEGLFPRKLFDAFNPNDKTNLAPYRFLHLMLLIILGARLIPIDAPGLKAVIWRPLIKCGQQCKQQRLLPPCGSTACSASWDADRGGKRQYWPHQHWNSREIK